MNDARGSVMVEFALVSFVLYLLLAAAIDFGRLMFSAQATQDAARVAARELAVAPLPAGIPFDGPGGALSYVDPDTGFSVPQRIFNAACLSIDRGAFKDDADPDAALDSFVSGLPVVNRMLRPLMIVDQGGGRNLLRYPGALLDTGIDATCVSLDASHPSLTTALTVGIPRVTSRSAEGFETIEWLPVLEEIRTGSPPVGPFSLTADLPAAQRGLVAVRINYPYQAAMISSFRPNPAGPLEPNLGNVNLASDTEVDDPGTTMGTPVVPADEDDEFTTHTFAGKYGLGRQLAFARKGQAVEAVRPYRRVLSGQAIFRREVFQ